MEKSGIAGSVADFEKILCEAANNECYVWAIHEFTEVSFVYRVHNRYASYITAHYTIKFVKAPFRVAASGRRW